MPGKLTAIGIARRKAPGKLYDGAYGLFLQVYPSGAKCWQQRLTLNGRRRTGGLGGYPSVSLVDARATSLQNWLVARHGADPFSKRSRVVPTFEQAADDVIEKNAPTWRDPTSSRAWRNTLARYVLPHFGKLPVSQVEIDHVVQVLTPIWNTRPETARRVRQHIRAILDWAIALGYRTDNPAGPAIYDVLSKQRPAGKAKKHHAAVPYNEVSQLLVAVRQMRARPSLQLLFEFVVLTVVRSGEARQAQWSEIDFDESNWFIPGERMKTGFPHRVPLSDRALQVLREVRELDVHSGTGLVFPGAKSGRPYSDTALMGLLRRLSVPATVHGLRSSFRDWVAETGAGTDEAAERALAHARTSQTVAAYLRTDLLEARRLLMQRWADYVTGNGAALAGP